MDIKIKYYDDDAGAVDGDCGNDDDVDEIITW